MSHARVSISLHIFSTCCCCCYYDASRFLHSPGVCRLIGDKMLLFLSVRRFHLSLENLCKVYHNLCVKLKEKRQHFSNWLWGMMQIRLNWGNSWFCFFASDCFTIASGTGNQSIVLWRRYVWKSLGKWNAEMYCLSLTIWFFFFYFPLFEKALSFTSFTKMPIWIFSVNWCLFSSDPLTCVYMRSGKTSRE